MRCIQDLFSPKLAEYGVDHNYDGSFATQFLAPYHYHSGVVFGMAAGRRCVAAVSAYGRKKLTGQERINPSQAAAQRNGIHVLLSFMYGCLGFVRWSQAEAWKRGPVLNSDEQLLAVLAALEDCRTVLASGGNRETAHLVSVAALDVRMKLNRIGDVELRALCDQMIGIADSGREAQPSQATGARPPLRLVK
jgi:hypothetical protein